MQDQAGDMEQARQVSTIGAWPYPHASTGSSTSEESVFRMVFWPNLTRWLRIQPVWSVGLSLFYTALETAGGAYVTHFGFGLYLVANLIAIFLCTPLMLLCWYGVASVAWRHSKAARIRYAREGMYALLPWWAALPTLIVATLLSGWLHHDAWVAFMEWTGTLTQQRRDVSTLSMSMVFYAFGISVIMAVDLFWVRSQKHRQRAETAHRLQIEAQLQRLQAQMEPHMLFNTLANLHALIDTQPGKAQDMLSHLIDYLRATLSASRKSSLALRDEIARVKDYLALMQIRMGERLRVELDIADDLSEVTLPAMLVQPLVENAIKHGLDPIPEGGTLRVIVTRAPQDMVIITVWDDGQGMDAAQATPSSSGFGLSCIKARLETCYGTQASLKLKPASQGRGTIATLRLPVRMPAVPLLAEPPAFDH